MNPFEKSFSPASPERTEEELNKAGFNQIAKLKEIESEKGDPIKTIAQISKETTLRIIEEGI